MSIIFRLGCASIVDAAATRALPVLRDGAISQDKRAVSEPRRTQFGCADASLRHLFLIFSFPEETGSMRALIHG